MKRRVPVPYYDYRCEDCSRTFEERRPIDKRDEAVCPDCGSPRVKRLLSRINTITSGGGSSCAPSSGGG
jgi:putative FmdB family regulatory protein